MDKPQSNEILFENSQKIPNNNKNNNKLAGIDIEDIKGIKGEKDLVRTREEPLSDFNKSPKKKINAWKIYFLLLLVSFMAFFIWLGIRVNLNYNNYENKINQTEKRHDYFVIRQQRLECMTKTLIVAYKLSKWEAYYYCTLFDDFSLRYNIPWEIFAATIRVESNFNPSAKSDAGCKGLMQLKESTAEELATSLDIRYNDKTLWNDILNIILGSTYLSTHIKEKGIKEGVKTYLGGPDYKRNVKKNHGTRTYVKEYKVSVLSEYDKLSLMFRGVVDELGYTYDDIYVIPHQEDTLPLVFTLFTDIPDTVQQQKGS